MVREHDLIEFIRRHFGYDDINDKDLLRIVGEHARYGTIEACLDNNKIVGLIRINIHGSIVEVCDFAIKEGYKCRDIIRELTLNLWIKFPHVKYFTFERLRKYPLKKSKIYTIKRLLKIKGA